MAEIRDPKRFYYAMRSKYMREAKQIGQKLLLATTEEEDALQWEKYKKVMKRWRALKKPEGITHRDDTEFLPHLNRKPEFNAVYTELTMEMKELYARLSRARSAEERRGLEKQIRDLGKRRAASTVYTNRKTGEPMENPD